MLARHLRTDLTVCCQAVGIAQHIIKHPVQFQAGPARLRDRPESYPGPLRGRIGSPASVRGAGFQTDQCDSNKVLKSRLLACPSQSNFSHIISGSVPMRSWRPCLALKSSCMRRRLPRQSEVR